MKRLLLILCLLVLSAVFGFSQNIKVDSLKSILPAATGKKKVEILHALVINLWLNHPDTALRYAREALQRSDELKDLRLQAISIRLIGGVYPYKGMYDSALHYTKLAHAVSIKTKDSTLISSTFNNLGFVYYHLGSYSEALENSLRSLNLKYKLKQTYGLGQTLNNVGLVYSKLKDFTTARRYFAEAKRVGEQLKDGNVKLYTSNNIGFSYLQQGNYSQSEKYFKESLDISTTVSNTNWTATAYSGLAQTFYKKGLIDRAKKQFKKSLSLRREIGDRNGIAEVYYYLSKMHASSGNLDSAFYEIRICQDLARQTKSKDRQLEVFSLYSELFSLRKQYDSAMYYQSRFIELRDNLFNENLARTLADVQLKVQEEETIRRLADKDVQIRQQTIQTYFFIALAVLTLAFLVILYRYYKVQKHLGIDLIKKNLEINNHREEIESQKETLVLTNSELEKTQEVIRKQVQELAELNSRLQNTVDIRTKELESANQELKVANLELDNFIYKSSHDIKGPLVRLLGLCHVALLDIKDNKAKEYFVMLNDTAKHINDIFDRLKIVSDINNLQTGYDRIDFDRILERVRLNIKSMEGYSSIEFVMNVENGLEFYSDTFLMETIIHNMLENAVKFQRKSELGHKFIRIAVKRESSNLKMCFTDNGIGIKDTDLDHMFKMFSKAALEHQTIGLGLYIVKQCIVKLGGTINLLRNKEKFTEFEIKLPGKNFE
jgi:signal transduction histidine kinase/Tfp pilus assembly protein PilF